MFREYNYEYISRCAFASVSGTRRFPEKLSTMEDVAIEKFKKREKREEAGKKLSLLKQRISVDQAARA